MEKIEGNPERTEKRVSGPFDYRTIDEMFHSRLRLAVVSILIGSGEADFVRIRDAVGTTDGNLNTHMRKLEEAGYVEVAKTFALRKPSTCYRLSEAGKQAFEAYVSNLEKFLHPRSE